MSNGDANQEQGPEIIVTDLGTNFNVDLRKIELNGQQRKDIRSAIINVILAGMAETDSANSMEPEGIEYGCNDYSKFRNY